MSTRHRTRRAVTNHPRDRKAVENGKLDLSEIIHLRRTFGPSVNLQAPKDILTRMASNPKVKRLVMTGAVTAITIAGTLYGAGIKTEKEVTQVG